MNTVLKLFQHVLSVITGFIFLVNDTSGYSMWVQNDDGIWEYCDE